MATLSNILAWEISWTEEPGRVQSIGRKESDTAKQLTVSLSFHRYSYTRLFSTLFLLDKYLGVERASLVLQTVNNL